MNSNNLRETYAMYSVVQWFFPGILLVGILYLIVNLFLKTRCIAPLVIF